MNHWEDLDKFSKAKKSPVGYEPFVDACLKYNKNDEALKYLPRCRDDIKVKYYVKAEWVTCFVFVRNQEHMKHDT